MYKNNKIHYSFTLTNNFLEPGYDPAFSDEDLSDQDAPQDEIGHVDEEGFETTEEEEVDMHEEDSESLSSEDVSPEVEHENEYEGQHEDEEPHMLNVSGSRAPGNIITSDTDDATVPEENQVAGPSRESQCRSKRQKKLRQ